MRVISQANSGPRLRTRLLSWPIQVLPRVQSLKRTKGRLRGGHKNRTWWSRPLSDTAGSIRGSTIALREPLYGRSLTREEQEDADEIWRQITRSQ
jgi:hypothetical protein